MKVKNQNLTKNKKNIPSSQSSSKPLSKSKSKSKNKNKKFNPAEYLNALIQLTSNANTFKVKKNKIPQKRDLSSALTTATPMMEKTISMSKIRCKSAYSQYRKKSSNLNNLKQVLNLNLDNYIITQESNSDCIKFTSLSSNGSSMQQTPVNQKHQKEHFLRQKLSCLKNNFPEQKLDGHNNIFPKNKLNYFNSNYFLVDKLERINKNKSLDANIFARKIQRAWRSYQTYKIVHKYYRHFKKSKRQQKFQMLQQGNNRQQMQRLNDRSQDDRDKCRNQAINEIQGEQFSMKKPQKIPSVDVYLNDYLDDSIQNYDYNCPRKEQASLSQNMFEKTAKIKIKRNQQLHNQSSSNKNLRWNHLQNCRVQSHLSSQSQQNSLNLTQKLNRIKQYVSRQSHNQHPITISQNNDFMQEVPTIQIKKQSDKNKTLNNIEGRIQEKSRKQYSYDRQSFGQTPYQSENSSTEKKNKNRHQRELVSRQQPNRSLMQQQKNCIQHKCDTIQHNGIVQNLLPDRNLDRTPTLKQQFTTVKRQKQEKSSHKTSLQLQPVDSIVNNLIKKQTAKYNQLLSLVQLCKQDKSQQSNSKANRDKKIIKDIQSNKANPKSQNILKQLLLLFESHKNELQANREFVTLQNPMLQSPQSVVQSQIGLQYLKTYQSQSQSQSRKQRQMPERRSYVDNFNNSDDLQGDVLDFDSKQIYRSYEDYQFSCRGAASEKSATGSKSREFSGVQQKNHIRSKEQNSQMIEQKSVQNLELLKKFESLLCRQQRKINTYFQTHSSKSPRLFPTHNQDQSSNEQNLIQSSCHQSLAQDKKLEQSSFTSQQQSSIYSFCPSIQDQVNHPTERLFNQHIKLIQRNKNKSIQSLADLLKNKTLSKDQGVLKLKQIQGNFEKQRQRLKDKKQKYIEVMRKVKRQAINFQKALISSAKKYDSLKVHDGMIKQDCQKNQESIENGSILIQQREQVQSSASQRYLMMRKSFSAQSIVLKCILKQPLFGIKQFSLEKQKQMSELCINNKNQRSYESQQSLQSNNNVIDMKCSLLPMTCQVKLDSSNYEFSHNQIQASENMSNQIKEGQHGQIKVPFKQSQKQQKFKQSKYVHQSPIRQKLEEKINKSQQQPQSSKNKRLTDQEQSVGGNQIVKLTQNSSLRQTTSQGQTSSQHQAQQAKNLLVEAEQEEKSLLVGQQAETCSGQGLHLQKEQKQKQNERRKDQYQTQVAINDIASYNNEENDQFYDHEEHDQESEQKQPSQGINVSSEDEQVGTKNQQIQQQKQSSDSNQQQQQQLYQQYQDILEQQSQQSFHPSIQNKQSSISSNPLSSLSSQHVYSHAKLQLNPPSGLISNQLPNLTPSQIQSYSSQLQYLVFQSLIEQTIEQIYLNDSIMALFKPFIENVFEFSPVVDAQIMTFIQKDLNKFYPEKQQLLQRANQKINPTSKQILRLVRDFDFQIQEYQLILAEDVFRKARKHLIQEEYVRKLEQFKLKYVDITSEFTKNYKHSQTLLAKAHQRTLQLQTKTQKYLHYQRDLRIMYMKAVFNCLNEFLIQEKSIATHMNCRSTIGTGELSLSIKEFNLACGQYEVQEFFSKACSRIGKLLQNKCMLPSFQNYKQVELFQKQMLKMIKLEIQQTEYKWLNYMDEVLEIWNQVAGRIVEQMIGEVVMVIRQLGRQSI